MLTNGKSFECLIKTPPKVVESKMFQKPMTHPPNSEKKYNLGLHVSDLRPGHNLQESCYCGHRHEHALSYQFLQLPNGLHLTFGPFNGNIRGAIT